MTDTAAVGLRERKKARTKELIETTALELFARDGFDATTVEAITDACEVSPRTFFRYFATKQDVLQGNVRARHERLVALLRDRPSHERPLESIREALRMLALEYEKERDTVLRRTQVLQRTPALAASGPENHYAWHQAISTALAGRMPVADLRLAAAAAGGAVVAGVDAWQASGGMADLQALILEAFDRLGGGLDG